MTQRLVKSAVARLDALDLSGVAPRRTGTLVAHEGLLLEVEGLAKAVGSAVSIVNVAGKAVRGEVVGFRGKRSFVLPFESHQAFEIGAEVEAHGSNAFVACGSGLLGRVIDALGEPLDGGGEICARTFWPLAGRKSNPLHRGRVTLPFECGVRAINGLLTIGEGQRIAIVAGSGVGKSVLLGQILRGAECDLCVVGMVGERAREVSDFVETQLNPTLRPRTVVVAVPADHAPHLRLRAAMRATAISESFRAEGKKVLLLIDSLTRVAHAQREIGLSLGEPPTMKGYPPSALALIPNLIERAGVDRHTGGSITAIYTVLADGGDTEDPVVDTARAIVDGHIILSRQLAEQGIFPAIDLGKSLSRTMSDVVDAGHLTAAARFRQLWTAHEDNRDLMLIGAYAPGNDEVLDLAVSLRGEMLSYVAQSPRETIALGAAQDDLIRIFVP